MNNNSLQAIIATVEIAVVNKIVRAQLLATKSHGIQIRKDTGLPYIIHPTRIAKSVFKYFVAPCDNCDRDQGSNSATATATVTGSHQYDNSYTDLVCAAYLHDTLEDTDITKEEILKECNEQVLNLVIELTSDEEMIKEIEKKEKESGKNIPSWLPKGMYLLKKMNEISMGALFIKLLDRLDNISDYLLSVRSELEKTGVVSDSCKALPYRAQTLYILDGLEPRRAEPFLSIINDIRAVCQEIQTLAAKPAQP